MERPKKPGEDATAAEIMEWMDADFAWAVAEGVKKGSERQEPDKEQE